MPDSLDPSQPPITTPPAAADPTSAGPLLSASDLIRLKRVGQGMRLICVTVVLEFVCAPLTFILMLGPSMLGFNSKFVDRLFAVVFGTLTLAALLALLIGICFCLSVPPAARAARFLIAAIAMAVTCFVSIGMTGPSPRSWGSERLIGACAFVTSVCILWFLRRLAGYIGERRLARRAVYILVTMLLWYGSGFVGPFPGKFEGPSPGDFLDASRGLVIVVAGLSYINLIDNLRSAVRRLAANA